MACEAKAPPHASVVQKECITRRENGTFNTIRRSAISGLACPRRPRSSLTASKSRFHPELQEHCWRSQKLRSQAREPCCDTNMQITNSSSMMSTRGRFASDGNDEPLPTPARLTADSIIINNPSSRRVSSIFCEVVPASPGRSAGQRGRISTGYDIGPSASKPWETEGQHVSIRAVQTGTT